jgi:hypothetical protein
MLQIRTAIFGCTAAVAFASVTHADLIKVDYTGAAVSAGLINTVAGGNATAGVTGAGGVGTGAGYDSSINYRNYQSPAQVIDNSTATKFCISNSYISPGVAGGGRNTGFYITLASASVVTAIQFTTANDGLSHASDCRTPLTITIEGSNAAGSDLMLGLSWTSLYSGTAGLDSVTTAYTAGNTVSFTNTTAYKSYRILVTATYGSSANVAQYSEVSLYAVPEPSTMLLGITGAAGLLAFACRKRKKI